MVTKGIRSKRTILSSMEDVITKAKEESLSDKFYEEAAVSLRYISKTLEISTDEALLLSLFFEESSSPRIWISDIARMVRTSNIRIIAMMNVADGLVSKGYIKRCRKKKDESWYSVPMDVVESIRQNVKPVQKPVTGLEIDVFFERLYEIMNEDDLTFIEVLECIDELVSGNMHLHYCKTVKSYGLCKRDEFMVHFFTHRLINEDDDMIGSNDWEDYMPSKIVVRRILNDWKSGKSPLIEKNIFEARNEDGVRNPNFYHFTDKAKMELFPDMELVEKTTVKARNLIPHTSFAPKQLFYPAHIQSQVDRLGELLDQEKFLQVTERLSENGMRKGFACLFYGSPGTGKTETVNQLARITGRDVMVVDVSRIKSCWVGESEKNIKALFDNYKELVRNSEVAPILLFNEADAVLGIRQEGAQRAVDKMENSIQNIILQEIETLEGIMIATTNLTTNLDKAFERRFIYKIEFERPTIEAKKQIWKSMIPGLPEDTAYALAKEFDLSGGQIENIARKRTVELILSGEEPTTEMLREYCKAESMEAQKSRKAHIGFNRTA